MMRIVVTAATGFEVAAFAEWLDKKNVALINMPVEIFYTGIGLLQAAVNLTHLMCNDKPGFIIQAGIAGCFDEAAALAKMMVVKEEILGDMGVEENDTWKNIFDLGLKRPSDLPFENGKLINNNAKKYNLLHLDEATAITVNEITTNKKRRLQLQQKYQPILESMEGAALHYTGKLFSVPFLQIRSTSNYIGERDKSKWQMKEAIKNLNDTLIQYFEKLISLSDEDKPWF